MSIWKHLWKSQTTGGGGGGGGGTTFTTWTSPFGAEPVDYMTPLMEGTSGNFWNSRSQLPPLCPRHGETIFCSTPMFSWPTVAETNSTANDNTQYTVRVYDSTDTIIHTFTSNNTVPPTPVDIGASKAGYNHAQLTTPLVAGNYSWDVHDPSTVTTSGRRYFTVAPGASSFIVPTKTNAYSTLVAKARPRFKPTVLSQYGVGQSREADKNQMVTRIGTIPVTVPTPSVDALEGNRISADKTAILAELTYLADLAHLYWLTGNASYQTTAVERLVGDGSVSGMIYWQNGGTGVSWTDDDIYRFHLMALSIGYDTFKAGLSAPQQAAAQSALAARIKHGQQSAWRLVDPTGTLSNKEGRWPGQASTFSGHAHNIRICVTLACAALAGDETSYASPTNSDCINTVPYWLAYAGQMLYWNDPMVYEDGSHGEGRGYANHSTDFSAAMACLGNAFGLLWTENPKQKSFGKVMQYLSPPTNAYHTWGDGDDHNGKWDNRAVAAGRRAGGIPEVALSMATGSITLAQLAQNKAIDYHWLSATAEPGTGSTLNKGYSYRYMSASHSSLTDMNRVSYFYPTAPDGVWNHKYVTPGSMAMSYKGQALFSHAGLYDFFNSQHQRQEKGWGQAGSWVLCANEGAASNGVQGTNYARRTKTQTIKTISGTNVFGIVRDSSKSTNDMYSLPAKIAGTGTGYLWRIGVKPPSVDQKITITATSSTTVDIVGTVSGSISTGASPTFMNNSVFYGEVAGAVVAGDVWEFYIVNATVAKSYNVHIGTGVQLVGKYYTYTSSQTPYITFNTRDVQAVTSVAVSSNVATITFPTTHGMSSGESCTVEVFGATPSAFNGVFTATWASATTLTYPLTLANQTATGTVRVNLGPITTAALGDSIRVQSSANTTGGGRAIATVYPITTPASKTVNSVGWKYGDASLNFANMNASQTEWGSFHNYQSPIHHYFRNRLTYTASTSFIGWCAAIVPDNDSISGLVQTVTGVAPNRTFTVSLVNATKTYTAAISESTGDLTLTEI